MGPVRGSVMLCHLKLVYQQYQRTNNTDQLINDTDQLANDTDQLANELIN